MSPIFNHWYLTEQAANKNLFNFNSFSYQSYPKKNTKKLITIHSKMGSCMSGDKKDSNLEHFRKDNNLVQKTEIYQPLGTTLFNTMRKHNDLIVIFNDANKAKLFSGVSLDDVKSLPPKSVKMMYSFKKVVVVGEFTKVQPAILQLTKSANINSVHIVSDKQFEKFQKSYSIFNSLGQLASIPTSKIPILVFSSQQLIKPPPKPHEIWIHLAEQKDTKIYEKLRISSGGIISPPSDQLQNDKEILYYLQKMKSARTQRLCLLHHKGFSQASLMQVLSSYLMYVYETSEISTKQYLSRSLPNVVIINHSELINQQPQMASSKLLQQAVNLKTETKSNTDEFHRLFKQHLNAANPEKTQRAYNLLGKLLANIISNPENQQYRKVKGMNKQMEELLTRTSTGVKLLRLVGFSESAGFWVNQLQSKYLKVLRTDMDLGYRKATTEAGNQ